MVWLSVAFTPVTRVRHASCALGLVLALFAARLDAQVPGAATTCSAEAVASSRADLQQRVDRLETEVGELTKLVGQLANGSQRVGPDLSAAVEAVAVPAPVPVSTSQEQSPPATTQSVLSPEDRKLLDFFHDTTVNLYLDTYYLYNFNHPYDEVNLLRAYDVLSNNFSLNQAVVLFERAPDVAAGRRWGARLDLQFGQATATLQGNPANEPRPDIYRNIFQAYGTYIIPLGKNGLTVDFGKWASSLGIEGNYTKDQMNYSRSYYFNFLPFYHMGLRANYKINDRIALNYWVVNGTNQAEGTNAFKDQLFGFVLTPSKALQWTVNYYYGQDHPDRVAASNCGPVPVQPGLCYDPITPAPNGRTHIFDNYATWQIAPKWTLAGEGDYFIQRLWQYSAPGESSAPSHVIGGASYIRYQATPKIAFAGRFEYLSDRGGLFSGITQALKETTATFDYLLAKDFLMRYEWRRDFSNQPSFLTDTFGVLSKEQNTVGVGLVWWWGRKEGAW